MIVVISGPSGVSKSYLCWEIIDEFKEFFLPKKVTTRGRREGEPDSEYIFASKGEFEDALSNDEFFVFTNIYGNDYGLPKAELLPALNDGRNAIFILDVFLAQKFKKMTNNCVLIYIMPVERVALSHYIVERSERYNEDVDERLKLLESELQQWTEFDYVIPFVNSEIAYQFLRNILISENLRPGHFSPNLNPEQLLQFKNIPRLAVDAVIFDDNRQNVILIERWKEPVGRALPGGFVAYGETTEEAIAREVREEVGVEISDLRLVGIFSRPSRDPRMHVVSIAYSATTNDHIQPGGDARGARWCKLDKLPKDLVFDHREIIEAAR